MLFSGEGSLDAAFSHTTRRECIGRVQPPDWSFNNTWKALQYPLLKRDMSPLWQARRMLSRLRTPGLCYRCKQVHGLEQVSGFLFSFRRKSCSKQQEKAVEKREPRQLQQWSPRSQPVAAMVSASCGWSSSDATYVAYGNGAHLAESQLLTFH